MLVCMFVKQISKIMSQLYSLWKTLYENKYDDMFLAFEKEIQLLKNNTQVFNTDNQWYRNAVVYSLYVDLFNKDFEGLQEKLPYLKNLGINCLWLLPILESPMRDAGFDISDYKKVRADLFNQNAINSDEGEAFRAFLQEAHKLGIKVIFDIAINHTSDQHYWFKQAVENPSSKYRDYYIWSTDDEKYKESRLLFKGMCDSNWEACGDSYYFHRFFEFQPDLNYRNPEVLLEMSRNLIFWMEMGVDGFRADAIPYLWKEDGTNCENLDKTHTIVKFFRAVIDYLQPATLLLAEACQPPKEVVKYMGDGDECHAGYHFPLMPQVFKAIAAKSSQPIKDILSTSVTPSIPEGCQWFTFLRCHDELSLELVYVSEVDRKYIHDEYCRNPLWDFRLGEGISARLADLMELDAKRILLAYSIVFSLPGTPVIYYGDEFAKTNDVEHYQKKIKQTGHKDTRFLVRGPVNWNEVLIRINQSETLESKVYNGVKKMLEARSELLVFGSGSIEWIDVSSNVLSYIRTLENISVLVIQNMSNLNQVFDISQYQVKKDIMCSKKVNCKKIELSSFSYKWLLLRK